MAVLLLAEHDNALLNLVTAKALTAALALLPEVDVLVAGEGAGGVAQAASKLKGVRRVLHVDAPQCREQLAEEIAPLIAQLAPGYTHVLAAATTTGKDILPRAAGLCDAPQVSDVVRVEAADVFVHPIYAGNALETVQVSGGPVFLTVRPTAFAASAEEGAAPVESIAPPAPAGLSAFVSRDAGASEGPDLSSARVVISGGRGLGSAENFQRLSVLAGKLGAALGASRAAVDAGYAPNDWQVGQTGKVVAPELYIALGISGAIQHLAGMKDSRIIVAINKDENAPIFELADYGLVMDLFTALDELEKAI